MNVRPLLAAGWMAALAAGASTATAANVDVGVSIGISQPGVYGRIDIGRFPQPQVVYAEPVYVERPRVVVVRPEPVYMWVPPGHRKNWKQHCRAYGACGAPVVFVRDDWYERNVRPHSHDDDRGHGKGKDKDKGHGKGKHGRDD